MDWRLPDRLQTLIESGFWPTDLQSVNRQNLSPLVSKALVKAWAPEEEWVFFDPPPFLTVQERIENGEIFWERTEADPSGISFQHAVVIGDFGLGSDAPIVLDYKIDADHPIVKRLRWGKSFSENRWIVASASFDEMCDALGLPHP